MKCPKCGFVQADLNDNCKKCGRDLLPFKNKLGITSHYIPGIKSSPATVYPPKINPEHDRLSFEKSRLEVEKKKLEKTRLPQQGVELISKERERLEQERNKLRSERIHLEAKRELEQRRLEKERQRQEQLKLQHEREMLRLEKIRLENERGKQQQLEIENKRKEDELNLKKEQEELNRKKLEEKAAARSFELEREKILKEKKEIERQQRERQEVLAELGGKREELAKQNQILESTLHKAEQRQKLVEEAPAWQKGEQARRKSDDDKLDKTVSLKPKTDFPPSEVLPVEQMTSEKEVTKPPESISKREFAPKIDLVIVEKGGVFSRALAGILDMIFISFGLSAFLLVGKIVFSWGMPTDVSMGPSAFLLLTLPVYILAVILAAGYFTYFHASFGQTPGKRILKLKVVDLEGNDPGYSVSLLRFAAGTFSFLLFFMGFFWIGLDLNKQGWHDKIAQTVVVKI